MSHGQDCSWPCFVCLAWHCLATLLCFGSAKIWPCLVSKGKPHHWVPTRGPGPGPKALTTQPLVRTAGHCFHLLPYRSFLRNRLPQVWGTGAFYVLQSVQIRPSSSPSSSGARLPEVRWPGLLRPPVAVVVGPATTVAGVLHRAGDHSCPVQAR